MYNATVKKHYNKHFSLHQLLHWNELKCPNISAKILKLFMLNTLLLSFVVITLVMIEKDLLEFSFVQYLIRFKRKGIISQMVFCISNTIKSEILMKIWNADAYDNIELHSSVWIKALVNIRKNGMYVITNRPQLGKLANGFTSQMVRVGCDSICILAFHRKEPASGYLPSTTSTTFAQIRR